MLHFVHIVLCLSVKAFVFFVDLGRVSLCLRSRLVEAFKAKLDTTFVWSVFIGYLLDTKDIQLCYATVMIFKVI